MPQLLNSVDDLEQIIVEQRVKFGKIDESLMEFHKKHTDALARLDAMETKNQRLQRMIDAGEVKVSVRDFLTYHKELSGRPYSHVLARNSWSCAIEAKDILNISPMMPAPVAAVASGPTHSLRVRSLFPVVQTTDGAVQFLQETAFTNNADVVAEGQPKPKSDLTYTTVDLPMRTIAHLFKVSKQSWDDLPSLAAEIESRGLYGLLYKEEQQLVKGSGVAPQMTGVYTIASALAAAPPTNATLWDLILLGASQLATAGYSATGAIVSAADMTALAMLKDSTGQYVARPAYDLPTIAASPHLAAGEWLVGDFQRGSRLYQRQDATVEVATQNVDDFETNKLTVRVELRENLAILQAGCFVKNAAPGTTETARKR